MVLVYSVFSAFSIYTEDFENGKRMWHDVLLNFILMGLQSLKRGLESYNLKLNEILFLSDCICAIELISFVLFFPNNNHVCHFLAIL